MRKWFEKVKHFAMPLCLLFALLGGPGAAHAQDTTITGRVTNEKGEFMNGATVMEVGTTNAVVTDANGQYTLKLKNANAVIEYSFLGFKPQEIRVGAQHVIDVVLVEDVSTLDELVVVGYGRQRKVSVVGAQSALRAEDIESFTVLKTLRLPPYTVCAAPTALSSSRPSPVRWANPRSHSTTTRASPA